MMKRFIPEVVERCPKDHIEGLAVLIPDECSAHDRDMS
jgi:hypothetical protein